MTPLNCKCLAMFGKLHLEKRRPNCSKEQPQSCIRQVSVMFDRATIHLGATELLGEYFSSSRKNYRPSSQRLSCMHCETYQKFIQFSGCGWPPSIILEGDSSRALATLEAEIAAVYNLNSGICCI
ncbi:hypothetical protein JHK85_055590 [Glycine max]|nr:hypothetical protein JHK86_054632 [Glycine max]KAG4929104.1 hypothetical protein JHK85_055590 [Glycine max]